MNELGKIRSELTATLTKGAGNMATLDLAGTINSMQNIGGGSASAALVTVVIEATIVGVNKVYQVLEACAEEKLEIYQLFKQDYDSGTSTVFLPKNEKQTNPTYKLLEGFIQLLQVDDKQEKSALFRYAGIHFTKNAMSPKKEPGTRYAVISMSSLLSTNPYPYDRSGDQCLDKALRSSDIFLQARLPQSLALIYHFESGGILGFFKDSVYPTSKLINLSVIRFMVLVFENLLINLQHPCDLDAETNEPLSDEAATHLCENVIDLINRISILMGNDENFKYLSKIDCGHVFLDFICFMKLEVEQLRKGHQSKKLNHLDLSEIVAQSQEILQRLNRVWYQILYLNKPMTESKQLLYLVGLLSNVLEKHPEDWANFLKILDDQHWSSMTIAGLNYPYRSAIDLIGLFAALSDKQRKALLKSSSRIPAIEYVLVQLNDNFISSFSEELSLTQSSATHSFFMNLLALSLESHPPYLQEPQPQAREQFTVRQQIISINNLQIESPESSPFTWLILYHTISQPTQLKTNSQTSVKKERQKYLLPQTVLNLKALMFVQYQFLAAVRNLDSLQELVSNNHNLLLDLKLLTKLKSQLLNLKAKADDLLSTELILIHQIYDQDPIDSLLYDDSSNQRRQFILCLQSEEFGFERRINLTRSAIDAAMTMISSPMFAKTIANEIQDNLEIVDSRYHLNYISNQVSISRPEQPELSQNQTLQSGSEQPLLNSNDTALQFQFILVVLRMMSIFLLIVGLVVLASLIFGPTQFSIIAGLSPSQQAVGMTLGLISSVEGIAGLGFCRFFSPVQVQNSVLNTSNYSEHVRPER